MNFGIVTSEPLNFYVVIVRLLHFHLKRKIYLEQKVVLN